jgi:hypothetical protein
LEKRMLLKEEIKKEDKIIKDFVFQQYNIILLSARSGSCFVDQL